MGGIVSRTDKTKPLRVKMAEHSPRERHDHRFGECDIELWDKRDRWETGQCELDYWWPGCCGGCCSWCHGSLALRWERRKDRHNARALIRRGDWDRLGEKIQPIW